MGNTWFGWNQTLHMIVDNPRAAIAELEVCIRGKWFHISGGKFPLLELVEPLGAGVMAAIDSGPDGVRRWYVHGYTDSRVRVGLACNLRTVEAMDNSEALESFGEPMVATRTNINRPMTFDHLVKGNPFPDDMTVESDDMREVRLAITEAFPDDLSAWSSWIDGPPPETRRISKVVRNRSTTRLTSSTSFRQSYRMGSSASICSATSTTLLASDAWASRRPAERCDPLPRREPSSSHRLDSVPRLGSVF